MQTEPIEIQGTPDEGALTPQGPDAGLRDNLSVLLIALGSVMLVIVMFRMLRRSHTARTRPAVKPVAKLPRPAPASQERLERLMTDAEELTRRLAAHLDNKAAHLDTLLNQVESRTAELKSLLERAERVEAPPPAAAPISRPTEAAPSHEPTDPMHRRVYELADRGLPPVEIARTVDRPTGQVELILALRRA